MTLINTSWVRSKFYFERIFLFLVCELEGSDLIPTVSQIPGLANWPNSDSHWSDVPGWAEWGKAKRQVDPQDGAATSPASNSAQYQQGLGHFSTNSPQYSAGAGHVDSGFNSLGLGFTQDQSSANPNPQYGSGINRPYGQNSFGSGLSFAPYNVQGTSQPEGLEGEEKYPSPSQGSLPGHSQGFMNFDMRLDSKPNTAPSYQTPGSEDPYSYPGYARNSRGTSENNNQLNQQQQIPFNPSQQHFQLHEAVEKEKQHNFKNNYQQHQMNIFNPLQLQQFRTKQQEQSQGFQQQDLEEPPQFRPGNYQQINYPFQNGANQPSFQNGATKHRFQNRNQQPLFENGGQSPFQNGGNQQPFQNGGNQQPFQNGVNQQPFQNEGIESPFQNGGNQSPFQNGGNQQPIQNEGNQQPFQNGGNHPQFQNPSHPQKRGSGNPGNQFPQLGNQFPPTGNVFPSLGNQNSPPRNQLPPRFPQPGNQFPLPGNQFPPPRNQFSPPGNQFPPPGNQFPPQGNQFNPQGNENLGNQFRNPRQQFPNQRNQFPPGARFPPLGQNPGSDLFNNPNPGVQESLLVTGNPFATGEPLEIEKEGNLGGGEGGRGGGGGGGRGGGGRGRGEGVGSDPFPNNDKLPFLESGQPGIETNQVDDFNEFQDFKDDYPEYGPGLDYANNSPSGLDYDDKGPNEYGGPDFGSDGPRGSEELGSYEGERFNSGAPKDFEVPDYGSPQPGGSEGSRGNGGSGDRGLLGNRKVPGDSGNQNNSEEKKSSSSRRYDLKRGKRYGPGEGKRLEPASSTEPEYGNKKETNSFEERKKWKKPGKSQKYSRHSGFERRKRGNQTLDITQVSDPYSSTPTPGEEFSSAEFQFDFKEKNFNNEGSESESVNGGYEGMQDEGKMSKHPDFDQMEKDFEKFSSGDKNFYDKDLAAAGEDFSFESGDFSDFEGVTNSWSGNGFKDFEGAKNEFSEFEGAKSGFSEFEGSTSGFSDFYDKKGLAKPTGSTGGISGEETTPGETPSVPAPAPGRYRKGKQISDQKNGSSTPWIPVVKHN